MEPRVYILDSETGKVIEQISKNLFFRGDDINYFIIQGNYLLEARDAETNERLWSHAFPGYIHGWPLQVGEMLLQNARGQIYGIRATTGEVVWQTEDTQKTYTRPEYVSSVALQDDFALALRYDAAMVGFNPETGEQVDLLIQE